MSFELSSFEVFCVKVYFQILEFRPTQFRVVKFRRGGEENCDRGSENAGSGPKLLKLVWKDALLDRSSSFRVAFSREIFLSE